MEVSRWSLKITRLGLYCDWLCYYGAGGAGVLDFMEYESIFCIEDVWMQLYFCGPFTTLYIYPFTVAGL